MLNNIAESKGDASEALAQALQEKVSDDSSVYCLVSGNLYILFSHPLNLLSGGSTVTFITAGRKTFTGEKY